MHCQPSQAVAGELALTRVQTSAYGQPELTHRRHQRLGAADRPAWRAIGRSGVARLWCHDALIVDRPLVQLGDVDWLVSVFEVGAGVLNEIRSPVTRVT